MKSFLIKAIPHVSAIVLFAIVSSVFFSKAYDDHTLRQGDIENFLGMSKEVRDYRDYEEEESLWTNSMFGGMPAYQISLVQSNNVPHKIYKFVRDIFPYPVGILFIAMISFYVLCLCGSVNPWVSMAMAVAYGLASVNILYLGAGHSSKVQAIALIPGVIGGIIMALRGKPLRGAIVLAIFLSMQIANNHPQMTYYALIMVLFIGLGELIYSIIQKRVKSLMIGVGALFVAALIAVLPNMTSLMTTYSYSDYSTRGDSEISVVPNGRIDTDQSDGLSIEYILEYSMARGEFWSMMIPNVKGGAAGRLGNNSELMDGKTPQQREALSQFNQYWGEQHFTGGAFYFGAIIMGLFLIALFYLKDGIKWSILAVSLLAIVLSWRDPSWITHFFIDSVPLFAKFRDTKMMLIVIQIGAPFLAALTLNQLFNKEVKVDKKWWFIGSGSVLLLLILFLAIPETFFDFKSISEQEQFELYKDQAASQPGQLEYVEGLLTQVNDARIQIFRADAVRSFFFILIAIAGLTMVVLKKAKVEIVLAALGVLIIADLVSVDKRYLNEDKVQQQYRSWVKNFDHRNPFSARPADIEIWKEQLGAGSEEQLEFINSKIDARFADDFKKKMKLSDLESFFEGTMDLRRPTERVKASILSDLYGHLAMRSSHYRVLSLGNTFSDGQTSYFHKSIGGYHGAKMRRFNDVVSFYLQPEIQKFAQNANVAGVFAAMKDMNIMNMFNVSYFLAGDGSASYPNPYANGNAWFVDQVQYVSGADSEILALEELDTKSTAVVHEDDQVNVKLASRRDSTSYIELESYSPDKLLYSSRSETDELAVFSEVYYEKGWKAYVDGNETPIVRANYLLRALSIPAGEHKIEFVFEPAEYAKGQTWSMIGSILIVLIMLFGVFLIYKSNRDSDLVTVKA